MRRAAAIGLAVAVIAAGVAAPSPSVAAGWQPPPPTYRLHDAARGRALQILPAGENGLVSATDLAAFEATRSRPAGSSDQLDPYVRLLHGDRGLTDGQLGRYFVDNSFGVRRGDVTRTETPDSAVRVVIYRDRHDIPHIYGGSLPAMAYGAGYAAAEDRLFFMDVLRHYGEGQLAAFVGPSCAIEAMDHDQLLETAYSPAELTAQLRALPREYGAAGARVVAMIDSYVAGINRYIAQTQTNPALLPADYAAAAGPPAAWTPEDIVATASLIAVEATAGGFELKNARLLGYLRHRLGRAAGRRAFDAFHDENDPAAPTTLPDRKFPYEIAPDVDRAFTAMPAHPDRPLAGGPTNQTAHCSVKPSPPQAALLHLLAPRAGNSNALVVSGRYMRDHHPAAVFGPELGYYAPQVLMEEDLHAPGYDAAGASFPGASFVIDIGRARRFAWSATTASTDQVDLRVDRLCVPGGGTVPARSHYYRFGGRCRAMTQRTFTETAFTKPGGLGAPVVIHHDISLTNRGVVQGWTRVGREPVAIVKERSTYRHEPDSFVGFVRWGDPKQTFDARTWIRAADPITYSFNWLYVDTHHIAYVVSGRDPVRNPHVDPSLPSWGERATDWRGLLPAVRHPHEIDPAQGWFASWNNKPAPAFAASDDMDGWGPVHRVQLITSLLHRALRRAQHRPGQLTRAELVTIVEEAATRDLSGAAVVPTLSRFIGGSRSGRVGAMLRRLDDWAVRGAHRRTRHQGDKKYADAAAVAIWDQAYPQIVRTLFDPVFRRGGVASFDGLASAYDVLPMEFALTPNGDGVHYGDGYYVGWEGYLVRALRQLSGRHVDRPFPTGVLRHLCGAPARCRAKLLATLRRVDRQLVARNGTDQVGHWTQDTATASAGVTMPAYDRIVFQALGIVGQPDIEWQNRPTYQQVVEFP